ncbi:MAG: glycosyltransferase family 2 protein [Ruminococcus sp.]|nr:glycosyltransferase family 2 protein [Ruminococcus sp.]
MNDVKVTVVCLTYNHKNFIRHALEGFVNQKTDFPFEVIVHDDASTDGTSDIIREYEEKYPEIIKAVCQKENKFSQGISPTRTYVFPKVRGEYLAICEGDDYWTDENKLQIQYDYMRTHPECALCVHQATMHDFFKNTDENFTKYTENREFSVDELIPLGGGAFATNSMVMKKCVYMDMPECFKAKGFSDYQVMINGALNGTVYYMARNMSVYNFGVAGSWTQRTMFKNKKAIEHCFEVIRMLNTFDEAYGGKYHAAVSKAIAKYEYDKLKYQGRFFASKKEPYREFYLADKAENGLLKCFVRSLFFRFDFLNAVYGKIKGRN